MYMEMRLDQLNPNDMPEAEHKFIQKINSHDLLFQLAAFHAEEAILQSARVKYKHLNNCSNVVIARVGSGGRFDGAAVGDQEFLIITKPCMKEGDLSDEQISTLIEELDGCVDLGIQKYSRSSVEHKDFSKGVRELLYHKNRKSHPYPARVLDSEYIAGNVDLFFDSKIEIYKEIRNNSKILKKIRGELSDYKEVCKTGITSFKGKSVIQFEDFSHEYSFVAYDSAKGIYGFKYAFIRLIQLGMSLLIYRYIKNSNCDLTEFLDIPPGIEEKIRYCLRKEWIENAESIIKVGVAYVKCIDIQTTLKVRYHQQYSSEREIVFIIFNEPFVERVREDVGSYPDNIILNQC
ncbi:TPA: hypothetical protein ACX6SJ_000429 [Photobacterium damselae]